MSPTSPSQPATRDVEAFMATLAHPLKPVVQALRGMLLGLDPAIGEAIKWNAPSFHTTEHFATLHLRKPQAVQVILHLGARARPGTTVQVDDPAHLLTWRDPQRATVLFASMEDLRARQAAFAAVVRQWMAQV
jgi:hypothetical protein